MEEGGHRRGAMDDGLVQLAREAFALFDKNNSGNIDQKVAVQIVATLTRRYLTKFWQK